MRDSDLFDAVAPKTDEDSHVIRRHGFMLAGLEDAGLDLDPERLPDVLLVDLPETGTVDGDAVIGDCGFRAPFSTCAQMARWKAKAKRKDHPREAQHEGRHAEAGSASVVTCCWL